VPTFAIAGSVVLEMAMRGGPLPIRVEIPTDRAAPITISCTEEQALAMEEWLRIAARQYRDVEADLYLKCAAVIARTRDDGPRDRRAEPH
jgi:hypothetical protein